MSSGLVVYDPTTSLTQLLYVDDVNMSPKAFRSSVTATGSGTGFTTPTSLDSSITYATKNTAASTTSGYFTIGVTDCDGSASTDKYNCTQLRYPNNTATILNAPN